MKKNKRLIILFSTILVLCIIIAGYIIYKEYSKKEENLEEINLGYKTCYVPNCVSVDNDKCRCIKCQSGYKLSGGGCQKIQQTLCNPGYYLQNGSCPSCPKGKECSGGTAQPQACGEGLYSEGGARECSQCGGITSSDHSKCYTCSLSYDSATNKVTATYNNGSEVQNVNINGYYSGSITPQYEGKYTGTVYYKDGKTCTATTNVTFGCPEGEYKPDGRGKCVKCEGIIETKNGAQICCIYSINGFPGKLSPGDNINLWFSAKDQKTGDETTECSIQSANVTVTNTSKGNGATISSVTQKVERIGSDPFTGFKDCSNVSMRAEIGNKVITATAEVSSKWSEKKEEKEFEINYTVPTSRDDANDQGSSYYNPFAKYECVTQGNKKVCQVYKRQCGDTITQTLYNYCCVDNGTINLSTKAEYKEKQVEKVCPANYTLIENVTKEECKIEKEEVGSCDVSEIGSSKQKQEAKECEGTASIIVDEGKQCTSTKEKTSFYEITCRKAVTTGFDYGNDGKADTIRNIYKGEGFAFGINVETSVNCKYVFYEEIWKKAYNNTINRIKKIDSNLVQYVKKNNVKGWEEYINKKGVSNTSELYTLWTIAEELRNAVKSYNEYTPSNLYNEKSEITIKTKEKGKEVINKYELLQIVNDKGTNKTSVIKDIKLNIPLVTDPKNYTLSSETPRKVKLIPKKVCIDRGTGKIITIDGNKCPNNTIDGGNKIYTNLITDVNVGDDTYSINITVTGLGSNDSEIINNKCNLKIKDNKYIYRPIDVENPFINSSWKKGKNWVNEKFDFTNVIYKNTWSDNTNRKIITLTAKEISAIKESNNRAWVDKNSPYMGLCNKQSEKLQDEITKKLCSLIK